MEPVLTRNFRADGEPVALREYEAAGGYSALRKALTMAPAEVLKLVLDADLRGRGGAGYPAGSKWSELPPVEDSGKPRLICVNFDEMEPGSFKDRFLVEHDPHQLVEGVLVAAYACQLQLGYVFVRGEYVRPYVILERALAEAAGAGYLGENILGKGWGFALRLHASAGRYICGEGMGLINSMEGKRAIPRTRPPHAATSGAWGRPTIVNNVETLCCVPHIVARGPQWFREAGLGDDSGPKIYGVMGRVRRPGSYELPLGTTLRELLEEHAGGMLEGYRFQAALPGGASTMYLDASEMEAPLGFEGLRKMGCYFGTGSVMVIDDRTCIVGATGNLQAFFARESCGWCTPCRDGLPWLSSIYQDLEAGRGQPGDLELLEDLSRNLRNHVFCLLATGATFSVESSLRKFRPAYEDHIALCRCPLGASARV
jgi:NADH-quinone oxidoreductase subunit F